MSCMLQVAVVSDGIRMMKNSWYQSIK